MGTDLQWLLERKHSDGRWLSLLDKSICLEKIFITGQLSADDRPFLNAAARNHDFFSILADVRTEGDIPVETLASDDIPHDLSKVAYEWMNEDEHGYYGFCWASLERIQAWTPAWSGIEENKEPDLFASRQQMISHRRRALMQILDHGDATKHVLRAPIRNADGELDFGLLQRSAHASIEDALAIGGLLPIAPGTARFFFRFSD